MNGNKKITFKTTNETTEFALIFKNIYKEMSKELKINKLLLNEKEVILNYKYLPVNIVHKIQGLMYKNKSTFERIVFIEDGLKVMNKNLLFGLGGNAWRYCYLEVQQYLYYADQMHSYPIKIGIETGILGVRIIYFNINIIFN